MTREDIVRALNWPGISAWAQSDLLVRIERVVQLAEADVRARFVLDGYRRCADGQRATQFCGQLEAAVKAEREACAAICDSYGMPDGTSPTAAALAEAIRERGQQ